MGFSTAFYPSLLRGDPSILLGPLTSGTTVWWQTPPGQGDLSWQIPSITKDYIWFLLDVVYRRIRTKVTW
jgi:hypothetical protein